MGYEISAKVQELFWKLDQNGDNVINKKDIDTKGSKLDEYIVKALGLDSGAEYSSVEDLQKVGNIEEICSRINSQLPVGTRPSMGLTEPKTMESEYKASNDVNPNISEYDPADEFSSDEYMNFSVRCENGRTLTITLLSNSSLKNGINENSDITYIKISGFDSDLADKQCEYKCDENGTVHKTTYNGVGGGVDGIIDSSQQLNSSIDVIKILKGFGIDIEKLNSSIKEVTNDPDVADTSDAIANESKFNLTDSKGNKLHMQQLIQLYNNCWIPNESNESYEFDRSRFEESLNQLAPNIRMTGMVAGEEVGLRIKGDNKNKDIYISIGPEQIYRGHGNSPIGATCSFYDESAYEKYDSEGNIIEQH